MADDAPKPPDSPTPPPTPTPSPVDATAPAAATAGTPTPPVAAGDKPASSAPAEPLKAEPSRTDSPGAGASAAGAAPAAKPAVPAAAKPAAAAKAAPHPPPAPAPPSGPTEPPPPAGVEPPAFIAALQAAIPGGVSAVSYYLGDWTIIAPVTQLIPVARHLRDAPDARFDYLSDLTATDWPPRTEARFDVVYCLYSTRLRHRVRVKVKVSAEDPVASVTELWPAANWLEREVYDMFGVNVTGHPDRRRILMPEDWQGFPQRKDYPLEGPGELLMENPIDWLKLRQAKEEAEIE
jgi:NADH-quinone oxidoreductase subunit C